MTFSSRKKVKENKMCTLWYNHKLVKTTNRKKYQNNIECNKKEIEKNLENYLSWNLFLRKSDQKRILKQRLQCMSVIFVQK